MAARVERESTASKRYVDEFLLEMSSQNIKRARTDPKLYPVVVTDVDKIGKIGKRMKIHYVRYSERYDEWRIATVLSSGWNLFVLLLILLLKTVRN